MNRPLSLLVLLPLFAMSCRAPTESTDGDGEGDARTSVPPGDDENDSRSDEPTEDLTQDPIAGVAPARAIVETMGFTDGPVWHAELGVLVFSMPLGETPSVWRMLPDGRRILLRQGSRLDGSIPIGNSIAADGAIIGVDAKRVTRMVLPPDGKGAPQLEVIATSTPAATFDTLNDVTTRTDGTIYVTDPGYFATPIANRILRIAPGGDVEVVEAFEDVPRPNGIALSPDEKSLYVGFSQPAAGTLPFVRRYDVLDDGTLGDWTKLIDVAPEDSTPDGLAADRGGNVYVATKQGIEVFRSDGMPIGVLPIPEKPTGMTFGGADMKTLYVTTEGTKLWELRLNIPGISQ